MSKYIIDYEFGITHLYTPNENWEERFCDLASQCFGIRKSIGEIKLLEKTSDKPSYEIVGEYERLEHNGDVIVWNKKGEKIKSEFDD